MNLRPYTPARVSLGLTGASQTTADHLAFQLAHAKARDAVHATLHIPSLTASLAPLQLPTLPLHSAAATRSEYLRRPDLGRQLSHESTTRLQQATHPAYDLLIVITDGLSALAIERHAAPLLATLLPMLPQDWHLAPICFVEQGRVAITDAIGSILRPTLSLVLVGERPGLSSPDSLGAYLTYQPGAGRTDAERNCVSNIRHEGLSYAAAAVKLTYLLTESHHRKLSGISLKEKDEQPSLL